MQVLRVPGLTERTCSVTNAISPKPQIQGFTRHEWYSRRIKTILP
uniref:Uncharacterized protein n=1 Tax=Anguilla anguilla TaxID=7936 RepID=A0A0E9PSA6_ANGAN